MDHVRARSRISQDAIPAALAKAERYRLLNEPGEAESICLDVLQSIRSNQDALVMLLLALTDQFPHDAVVAHAPARANDARRAASSDDYDRAYYAGIIRERRAKAVLQRDGSARGARRRRVAARGDGLLRARRSGPSRRQRRRAAALERVRAPAAAPAARRQPEPATSRSRRSSRPRRLRRLGAAPADLTLTGWLLAAVSGSSSS